MKPFSWRCPYCNHDATIGDSDHDVSHNYFTIENAEGLRALVSIFIVCPNPECKKYALAVSLHELTVAGRYEAGRLITSWRLVPPSKAKPFPSYIPRPIIDDYSEACLISDLSPKASASLARRCLQGIIRDFWKVSPGRSANEIEQIKEKTDPVTWEAIDSVRKVGNIGAHMEEDINLIIEVEPNEAQLLIELIETLLSDWYIAREAKKQRLAKITELAKGKEDQRKKALP
jgi:hypothetical protein